MDNQNEIPVLIEKLKSKDTNERRRAAFELYHSHKQMDTRVVEPLILALNDTEPAVRGWAARAISIHTPENVIGLLLQMFNDPEQSVREDAGQSLRTLLTIDTYRNRAGNSQIFIDLLKKGGKFSDVQEYAAWCLESLMDLNAVDELIEKLRASDFSAKATIAEVLGKLKSTKAIKPLMEFLDTELKELEASSSAFDFETAARAAVRATAAVIALGELGDKIAADSLVRAARVNSSTHSAKLMKAKAAAALVKIGDKRATSFLTQLINDPAWEIRREAVFALGRTHDASAVAPILLLLTDAEAAGVRQQAALALLEIGDRKAMEHIEKALRVEKDERTQNIMSDVINKLRNTV